MSTIFDDRYELTLKLGQGGIGQVWLAKSKNKSNETEIALKYPLPIYKDKAPFIEEARLMQKLEHPNIVKICTIGNNPEHGEYYTMEYLPDGSLMPQFLPKSDRARHIPEMENLIYIEYDYLLEIMKPILNALAFAHTKGVLHRDFKLSNILVDGKNERFVLTDFSLNAGAPVVMSPEQLREHKHLDYDELDWRSDLYAVGACMYYLLTGVYPFVVTSKNPEDHVDEIYDLIFNLKQPINVPSKVNPHNKTITPAVDSLIVQLLQRSRRAREGKHPDVSSYCTLNNISGLIQVLDNVNNDAYSIFSTSIPEDTSSPPDTTKSSPPFSPLFLMGFSALIVILMIVGVIYTINDNGESPTPLSPTATFTPDDMGPMGGPVGSILPGYPTHTPTSTPTPSPTRLPTSTRTPTPSPTPISRPYLAPNCRNDSVRITYPGENQPLSTMTEIRGIADDLQFDYYKIEYLIENSSTWSCCVVNPTESRISQNGVLGSINPDYPDPNKPTFTYKGKLGLRLVVVREDGNYSECLSSVIIR